MMHDHREITLNLNAFRSKLGAAAWQNTGANIEQVVSSRANVVGESMGLVCMRIGCAVICRTEEQLWCNEVGRTAKECKCWFLLR